MTNGFDYNKAILDTWKTNNRTTVFLIEHIPVDLWNEKIPGLSRTIGMIASHIHNVRCMWIKMIGKGKTIKVPRRVNPRHASCKEVAGVLGKSNKAMLKLLKACIDNGGKLPSTPAWLNFPNDVVHFLSYFIAHEGHHRGQIILLTRQLNHPLPKEVTTEVWQWKKRLNEAK
jgi:uncharacterized damage-inducible protein DinB